MLFYTHIAFALLIGLFFTEYFPVGNVIVFYIVLILSSLLLDIDDANSKVGKKLGIISNVLNFFFGHRDFFHSFLFIIPLYIILEIFTSSGASVAFLLGTCSHLVMDALTPSGVAAFYPLKHRMSFKIKTGGWGEKVLFLIILLVIFYKIFVWH